MVYNLINITYILLALNPNNIVFIISSITNFILFITSLKILGEPLVNPRYSVNENESPQILQIYKKLSVFQPMKIRLWRLLLAFLPWIIIEFWLVANFFSNGESIFLWPDP